MTKKVSKRWTEVEAQQVLAEQVRSGLSDRAFARKKGLDPQRLWWWCKRLEQSGQDEPHVWAARRRPAAVPVDVELATSAG
jgi:transposase-like protein